MADDRYMVCGCRPWSREAFNSKISKLPGEWQYVDDAERLAAESADWKPTRIYFVHWSWIVPPEIVSDYECVNFHMTDVPYGRGGSPLQNLIVRGHQTTKLTALRMTNELDAGPVYLKAEMALDGRAEEIYRRMSDLAADMIHQIQRDKPTPTPQKGEPVVFKRRKPAESAIGDPESLTELYDFVRMLDAEGYPHAFLDSGGFRYTFSDAVRAGGSVKASVEITALDEARAL